ncbi:hypothetical protein BX616_001416 [Lobosporangium transversale]|uniref:TIP-1 family-domain-containing protein n=1 Tax=Lobosporangium transversale TaxID=64571 RepID=A0A1Y2GCE9_9FUNG|nr:TIP-1 family-domain-containing protein [Lobosporangium transversale]KAF9904047.1 hypothetical protein BX616_001416 [Lobosporangium transversale]ORZ05147.1 TIP-1 family-domain-containing protein [Lobosporangium transversale]|eukprot:XP_021876922.1 TIP-1 family-domain-containing protein [Lobosporangium transversale]
MPFGDISTMHDSTGPALHHSNVVVFDQAIDVNEDVTDYFNARFSSQQDLVKIKPALQQQIQIKNELQQKLEESKNRTSKVLEQAQMASKVALGDLKKLESSALDLEGQMEESEAFASGKNRRDQRSLIEELSDLQKRAQALEDAKHYILIVTRTQQLISESRTLLESSVEQALVPYSSLVQLSSSVKETLGGHNTKLENYLTSCAAGLLQEFKVHLAKKFQASLDAIGWPTPIPEPSTISNDKLDAFEDSFKDLLLLQEPTYGTLDRSGDQPYPPLLTTELMVAPLILRFRYHFEGKRSTNRLDKPEWYLSHVLELIKEHTSFLQDFVQTVLQNTQFKEYDVRNDFIRLLLQAVERKIRQSVHLMLSSPELLSHAIYETLRFDKTLRENEYYLPPGQKSEWQGVVQIYFGNRDWLKAWLRAEKEFAVARYTQIIEDADAWQPAYEGMGEKDYIIPTKSAEKIMDLLEIITDRYRPLPVLEHRTFLLDIQLDLLKVYLRHILGLVDQYESLTYSFVRVMPGAASADELNTMGIEGLRKLCQWLSSVEYISSTLKDWGEDVLFLELYKEILERTQRISNPLHSENEDSEEEDTGVWKKKLDKDGAIFDDTVQGCERLSKKIQELIIRNITKDVFGSMKPYVSLRSWPQIEFSAQSPMEQNPLQQQQQQQQQRLENDDVSPELYQPITLLTHGFEFLYSTLPAKYFTLLYKQTSLEIQDFIWQKIIMKNSFSELGGQQFARDIRIGLFGAGRKCGIKRPENYHRKLRDAAILLSLHSAKANSPLPLPTPTMPFDHAISSSPGSSVNDPVYAKRTLAQMMAVLFDDDLEKETIKGKLEEIGVMSLEIAEAKAVVRRRVECWR